MWAYSRGRERGAHERHSENTQREELAEKTTQGPMLRNEYLKMLGVTRCGGHRHFLVAHDSVDC